MQRTPWAINNRVLDVQIEIYAKGLGIGIPSNVKLKPKPFPEHLANVKKEDLNEQQKEELLS